LWSEAPLSDNPSARIELINVHGSGAPYTVPRSRV
jgi:hypothetical protein